MAGVERAKKALWSLLRSYNARGSAKLTVTTAKGKLKVILEESLDVQPTAIKATKRPSPAQLRQKERRAATLLSVSKQLSIKLKLQPPRLEKSWQALKRNKPALPSPPRDQPCEGRRQGRD